MIRTALLLSLILAFAGMARAQLTRVENTTLALPADIPSATGYGRENALGTQTFTSPICTAFPQGETNRLFVAERGGTIQVVTNLSTTPSKALYFSIGGLLGPNESLLTGTPNDEYGLLSLVFHPNFATNGTFFIYYSLQVNESGTLRNYQRLHKVVVTTPSANSATVASHMPLLTIRDRDSNHNGGDLHFGPDGYLYLSTGDEGGSNDFRNNARHINHNTTGRTGFWGQLLRLDVDNDPANLAPNPHVQSSSAFPSAVHPNTYRIPADNPFIGYTRWHSVEIDPATVRTEIYATGLRNPFRFSFDAPTGRLFLGDVGQNIWEEVDIIVKGGDYGWSWREGDNVFGSPPSPSNFPGPAQPGDPPGTGFNPIAPIFQYDHTNSGSNDIYGNVITGGMVMRGDRLQELFWDPLESTCRHASLSIL